MRIVLDTNVLIAALIARGVCAELLEHCVSTHTMVTSDFILGELRGHLIGKFKYSDQDASDAIALLESQMEIVTPVSLEQPVCRDPDDDQILATAIAGQAACIVTGDKDLLVLRRFKSVEIVSPSDFAEFETTDDRPAQARDNG
ncbi:MAG: putative toxin-antitoxin system toxin component, PIN family [Planctomycetota bacterium]|nr:putative toxin-antitoxin system toxin component, PIN family [Planctomycetota bacterium]